ncbi:hypothetical protein [Azotobacter vinelandii]|uniref:hypothetical protein n=1 Tax=Azotobacter vinelandii TaxID=354 RepID=UPI001114AFD6|nr:hypothetical protein [Azotobacter vinelandii]
MSLIGRLAYRFHLRTKKKQIQEFIDGLSAMDGHEIGFVVACATNTRHILESEGLRLMDPIVDVALFPDIPLRINNVIRELQKSGSNQDAAGAMVWLHTARVGASHELRPLAREMWRQLSRGFPHVDAAALEIMKLTFRPVNVSGYETFPAGLTPDPL